MKEKIQDKKRVVVYFSGTVQGVGFRFTTLHLARSFRVTGYVKNLINGQVEVLAEGKEKELNDFIVTIQKSSLGRYIRDMAIDWSEYRGEFSTFEIGY